MFDGPGIPDPGSVVVFGTVSAMEWLSSPFTLLAIGYVVLLSVWFIRKLNRDQVVPSGHATDDPVDAIQFFWRPG